MFLVNSRSGLFTAATLGFTGKRFHLLMAPLLPKLRGHFAEFLCKGSLEHLRILSSPTCVGLRYGHTSLSLEVFLGSMIRDNWLARRLVPPSRLRVKEARIFLSLTPTRLDPLFHQWAVLSLLRHPVVQTKLVWFRNINRIPIAYAFRPRLRGRLTLSGLAFLRKP